MVHWSARERPLRGGRGEAVSEEPEDASHWAVGGRCEAGGPRPGGAGACSQGSSGRLAAQMR